MLILGIETSCDETAAAVVRDSKEVLSNVIASQVSLHAMTGGVVPEVAAREHVAAIIPVIKKALQKAKISFAEIDAIAVTNGPGLASSLLAGVVTANTLAKFSGKKLIGVNHILGHIRANWLNRNFDEFKFPIVVLTASGGHNELVFLKSAKAKPKLLGETCDDAVGEAFDKVARLLGLSYPGGPEIEKIAQTSKNSIDLPRAWLVPKDRARNFTSIEVGERLRNGKMQLDNFNFSFSGLKSEVRRRVQNSRLTRGVVADFAAGFQEAVTDVLATKLFLVAQKFKAQEIHLAGGVSANKFLRARVGKYAQKLGITFRHPNKMEFCTDNAAMIAAAAEWIYQRTPSKFEKINCVNLDPNLQL